MFHKPDNNESLEQKSQVEGSHEGKDKLTQEALSQSNGPAILFSRADLTNLQPETVSLSEKLNPLFTKYKVPKGSESKKSDCASSLLEMLDANSEGSLRKNPVDLTKSSPAELFEEDANSNKDPNNLVTRKHLKHRSQSSEVKTLSQFNFDEGNFSYPVKQRTKPRRKIS